MSEKEWTKPTSVSLTPSQRRALAELARQQGLSRSGLVVRWIEGAKAAQQQEGHK